MLCCLRIWLHLTTKMHLNDGHASAGLFLFATSFTSSYHGVNLLSTSLQSRDNATAGPNHGQTLGQPENMMPLASA